MKIFRIILTLATLMFVFAACNGNNATGQPAQPPEPTHLPMLETSRIFINYSPYVRGLSPELNSPVPLELRELLVRPELFRAANLRGSILIDLANSGLIDVAVVGSEILFRGDFSPSVLIGFIEYARAGITDPNIPVTTSDTAMAWIENPALVEAVDIILVTIYPFFSNVPIEYAAAALAATYADVVAVADGRQVIISETGWPTAGSPEGVAVPSPENAARFFAEVNEWAVAEGVEVIFFSAFDEAWKREGVNLDIGMHWGHFYADGTMKEAFAYVYSQLR